MPTTYREKLSTEISMIPEAMLPKFYRVFHTMIREMVPQETRRIRKTETRPAASWNELYGLGKGVWDGQDAQEYVNEMREDRP